MSDERSQRLELLLETLVHLFERDLEMRAQAADAETPEEAAVKKAERDALQALREKEQQEMQDYRLTLNRLAERQAAAMEAIAAALREEK
jgi:hypothetical protein